jgi:signal transduction histidine kinase
MMGAGSSIEQTLPWDSEARLASFTELVAMAIANAESRAELKASRARIITATDEMRRRIERDLHDGAQQQLATLLLELQSAQAAVPSEMEELRAHHARMEQGLDSALTELREISRGIHPAILTKAGLGSALKTLARRSLLPVELELRYKRRLPEHIEVAAYYVVSEALTNAAKHAHASVVTIDITEQDAILKLAIRDDGVGGADPSQGTGLAGLADRVETLGGRLKIVSPAKSGTSLSIEIPVEGQTRRPRRRQVRGPRTV